MSNPDTFQGTARFEVQRRLGEGGMGVVYQVFDRHQHAIVALKTLREDEPAALYRFKQEFRSLADINHPNLVTLHELVFIDEGNATSGLDRPEQSRWFFTMELVDGVDFLTYVRDEVQASSFADTMVAMPASDPQRPQERPLRRPATSPPGGYERLRLAMRQLAEGVHALHEAGKLHRDIKPSNVLVTASGRVVLVDFGLVTEINPADARSHNRLLVGTAVYMAPEQAVPDRLTGASDWYSVGCILYEALTGTLPFDGPPLSVLMEKQEVVPPAPSTMLPDTPADLDELCMGLLQINPTMRPSGRSILKRLGSQAAGAHRPRTITRSATDVFIGREQHFAALDSAFGESCMGRVVAMFIHGRSGMGKTALLDRFLVRLSQRDVVVLEGRCYERELVPYKALDTLIDSLTQYLSRLHADQTSVLLPVDSWAIARLFPVLRRINAVATQRKNELANPHELRRRATVAMRELLARIAARSPLVLSIDNLQWGDVESISLLVDLLRPPAPPPLLLLVCYRSEDATASGAVRALMRSLRSAEVAARDLIVGALDGAETMELVKSKLGDGSAEMTSYAESLVAESGGNPFFVDELVRYILVGGVPSGSTSISLEEAIWARAGQLPEAPRRLLELIAVAGRPIEQAAVADAAELGAEFAKSLAVLRAGYLIRSRGNGEQDRVEIYHDRIRETIAAGLEPEEVRDLHARLARALEASNRATPEALVFHFQGAGDSERAGHHAAAAARKAAEALAFDRATEYYRLAIDNLPATMVAERRLHVKLGDTLASAGRGQQAAEEYLCATGSAASTAVALELKRRAAEQLLRSGYLDQGREVLGSVLEMVGMQLAGSPQRAMASLLARRAQLRVRGLGFKPRDPSQLSAEELTRIDVCWTAASGLGLVDTIHGADFQSRHLLLALKGGERYRVARALAMEAMYSATGGRPVLARTERLIAQAEAIAAEVDNAHARALALLARGIASYQSGSYPRAREQLERCNVMLRDQCPGAVFDIAAVQLFTLDVLFCLGEIGELCRLVPQRLREADARGDLYLATDMRLGWPNLLWLAADAPQRAKDECERGLAGWSQRGFYLQHYYHGMARTNAELYGGEVAEARQRVMQMWPLLQRNMMLRLQVLRLEVMFLRGRTAVALAVARRIRSELGDAAQMAKKLAAEPLLAAEPSALVLRAGIAYASGDTLECAAQLKNAARGFDRAHMKLMSAACRRQRGELIGGDEGAMLRLEADDWMRTQEIKSPERMTAFLLGIPRGED